MQLRNGKLFYVDKGGVSEYSGTGFFYRAASAFWEHFDSDSFLNTGSAKRDRGGGRINKTADYMLSIIRFSISKTSVVDSVNSTQ